jgi:hypothetical protein
MKLLGWILFLPALLIHLLSILNYIVLDDYLNIQVFAIYNDTFDQKLGYFYTIQDSFAYEALTIFTIVGAIFIGFSKLKVEDEYTIKIRYESLVWATYFNYGLILLFTIFIYGISYLNVLTYNMFTFLIFFILRFHFRLYQLKRISKDDE